MRKVYLLLVVMILNLHCISHAGSKSTGISGTKSNPSLSLTYLANEGVLLQSPQGNVIIDGLFRDGIAMYERVDRKILTQLEQGEPPYDKIDLVLVTHHHRDHFEANSVAQHLMNNSEAALVTSGQVADPVKKALGSSKISLDRINVIEPAVKNKISRRVSGINVDVLRLSHGEGRFAAIWNLGFIVHLGGQRILHIGDSELNEKSMEPLTLFATNVDVACIPYWWLVSKSGIAFIRDVLKPKHLIAFHIPPAESEDVTKQIHEVFPDAWVCTKPMEIRKFKTD